MARVLNRPMFRKGGSANEGIMHGLVDRKGYETGTNPWTKEAMEAYSQIERPRDTSLSEMLVGGGLNLVSGRGAGSGLMANVARSFDEPSKQYFKSASTARDFDRKLKMAATQAGLEQKWKLEQIKAQSSPDTVMYNMYLEQAFKNDMSGADAQRFANYHTTTKEELRQKIGNERLGGILEVDLSTLSKEKQRDRLSKMKREGLGKFFYDPFDGKIKKLVQTNEGLGFIPFDSVADITAGDLETAEVITKSPYKDALDDLGQVDVPPTEDIFAKRFP